MPITLFNLNRHISVLLNCLNILFTFGQIDQSDQLLNTQSPGHAIVHKFTPSGRVVQSQYSSDNSIPVFM